MAQQDSGECAGGGLQPARSGELASTGLVGVCPVCGETLRIEEASGVIPRHYRPGERREGHESAAPAS